MSVVRKLQTLSTRGKTKTNSKRILKFALVIVAFLATSLLLQANGNSAHSAQQKVPAPPSFNKNRLARLHGDVKVPLAAASPATHGRQAKLSKTSTFSSASTSALDSQRPLAGDERGILINESFKNKDARIGGHSGLKQKLADHSLYQANNLSGDELKRRASPGVNGSGIGGAKATVANVFPSKETDGNGQVVYVNFTRVVSDASKNDTTRAVSNNARLIKRDGQIPCGETNRNGKPSTDGVNVSDTLANRIVGGNKADPGEFPFQVRLNIRSLRGSSLCGGVIIDKRHILTAAHCITTCSSYFVTSNVEPTSVQATIGDHRITVADGEQTIGIEKVTPHQKYSACSYTHNNYDLAILKTSKPMSWIFTEDGFGSVNRICLPHPFDEYQPGENVSVSGWGVMAEDEGRISNTLQVVDIQTVSLNECKVAYGQRVSKDHVCAGVKEGGKDSCQGDSGGPLFRRLGGQCELIGIVSFGYGCAQAGSPGVYTKVSHYIDWIKQNL